jgi:hypothetical protein
MHDIDDKAAVEHLRQTGWTPLEIERLRQFRCVYAEKRERTLRDHRCLAFVRWLMLSLEEGFLASGPWWW